MSAISSASLSRNVLWNFAGQAAPLFAAVFSIPLLIRGMGVDRFGLLTLAWMVIGYFSLFDFGLGRALIKLVSEKLAEGRSAQIPELIWTALFLMTGLGIAGAVLMFALSGWLVTSMLKIPVALHGEALDAGRRRAGEKCGAAGVVGTDRDTHHRFSRNTRSLPAFRSRQHRADAARSPHLRCSARRSAVLESVGRGGVGTIGGAAADLRHSGGSVRTGDAWPVAADILFQSPGATHARLRRLDDSNERHKPDDGLYGPLLHRQRARAGSSRVLCHAV